VLISRKTAKNLEKSSFFLDLKISQKLIWQNFQIEDIPSTTPMSNIQNTNLRAVLLMEKS
jgi:hypothetical protein